VAKESGLLDIHPFDDTTLVDDFLFDPCGYSANALNDRFYYNIHVTPQEHCSYASFETNVSFDEALTQTCGKNVENRHAKLIQLVEDFVRRVLRVFRPAKFIITVLRSHETSEVEEVFVEPGGEGFSSELPWGKSSSDSERLISKMGRDKYFTFWDKVEDENDDEEGEEKRQFWMYQRSERIEYEFHSESAKQYVEPKQLVPEGEVSYDLVYLEYNLVSRGIR
jgi:hypothetical protein